VCPGPFLITYGTIWNTGEWSFFSWLLGKTRPGPKTKRLKRHTRKCKWAVALKRPGYSVNNFSTINSSLKYSWLCVHRTLCWCVYGWVRSMFTIFWVHVHFDGRYQPSTDFFLVWGHIDCQNRQDFFLYESTSTVDFDQFFAEIDGWCDIDRIFKPSRWILVDRWYRPYSQVGKFLSTVDIDRILK